MIFLDLDEVLCDFVTPALQVHGRSDLLQDWPAGTYRLAEALGLSTADFWRPIDACGTSFWAELPLHPWALELFHQCRLLDQVRILTTPGPCHHSHAGKVLWLQRHLGPEVAETAILTAEKWRLAKSETLLVDDSDLNVAAFRAAGGSAVLMPQPWNDLGRQFSTPVAKFRYVLKQLLPLYSTETTETTETIETIENMSPGMLWRGRVGEEPVTISKR